MNIIFKTIKEKIKSAIKTILYWEWRALNFIAWVLAKIGYGILTAITFVLYGLSFTNPFNYYIGEDGKIHDFVPKEERKKIVKDSWAKF